MTHKSTKKENYKFYKGHSIKVDNKNILEQKINKK